jgi:hypothetical protein
MQVGAEDRNKLIAAVILMILAVLLLGRWVFSMTGSSSAAATVAPAGGSPAAQATPAPAPRRIGKMGRNAAVKRPAGESHSLDPTLRFDWLKASEATEYKGSGRNIFEAQIFVPKPKIIRPVPPPVVVPSGPPQPPPPPPIDLKFFGFASKPGEAKKRVFLSQAEDVFIAGEGDIVDRRYRVLRISPMAVEIEDVLNNNRQEIPLTTQ